MSGKRFENVKCLMFDLDNTLIVRKLAVAKVVKTICRLWFSEEPENHERIIETFAKAFASGYISVEKMWSIFTAEIDVHGKTWQNFHELWSFYYPFYTTTEPSLGALEELRKMGYKLVLLTNGSEIEQNAKIDAAGIRGMFDEVFVSGSIGVDKPDPEAFRYCMNKSGVSAEETVYVGDYWLNDIVGARDAGMRTVWMGAYMEWHEGIQRADADIHSLWELVELFPDISK